MEIEAVSNACNIRRNFQIALDTRNQWLEEQNIPQIEASKKYDTPQEAASKIAGTLSLLGGVAAIYYAITRSRRPNFI